MAKLNPLLSVEVTLLAVIAGAACTAQVDAPAASHPGVSSGAGMGGAPGSSDAAFVLTMSDGGTADAPPPTDAIMTCAEHAETAKQVPVDILFVLDGSSSMGGMIGDKTKWQMA